DRGREERLRMSHEEDVVLLIGHELWQKMLLEEILNRSVLASPKEADSRPDAFRIGIDDEDRMSAGVEEDRVRRLRRDAVQGQEVRAHHVRRTAEIARQVAIAAVEEMTTE